MSGITLTITDAGRAALVNAGNTGTTPVLMAEVGISATAVTPTPTATTLPGEIKRLTTFAGDVVAPDTIHVTVRDETDDTYTVRSLGLYLEDGTLFALYGQTAPIMEKSAQAMLLLALDVIFADIEAATLTFGDTSFLNPPATTERQGVIELATEAETKTGSDANRAVTPKTLRSAVNSWLDSRFGEDAPSAFVKTLLSLVDAPDFRAALEIQIEDVDSLEEALSALVPNSRTLTTTGLLTGGGSLQHDRTLGVPRALPQDLIDGDSNDLALTPATFRAMGHLREESGYYRLPFGLIIQWGAVAAPTGSSTFFLPITFPTAFFMIIGGGKSIAVGKTGLSQFYCSNDTGAQTVPFIAIGR